MASKFLMKMLIWVLVGTLCFSLHFWKHETVHAQHCIYAGGEPNIYLSPSEFAFKTHCEGIENLELYYQLAGETEAIGYHQEALLFELWALGLLFYTKEEMWT